MGKGFTTQKTVFQSGQFAAVYGDWIQTAGTSISAAEWIHNTPNDSGSETEKKQCVITQVGNQEARSMPAAISSQRESARQHEKRNQQKSCYLRRSRKVEIPPQLRQQRRGIVLVNRPLA